MNSRPLTALLACLLLSSPVVSADDEYVVYEYRLTWPYKTVGGVEMGVSKDEDRTLIYLSRLEGFSTAVYFLPEHAEAIGDALAKTDEMYKKYKDAPSAEVSDSVAVGDHAVIFMSSPESGFSIWVRDSGSLYDYLMLDRREATELARAMAESTALARFLDSKVDL